MKKREAADAIYRELANALSGSAFELKRRQEAFMRPIKGGWQELGVPLADLRGTFRFSLSIGVRLDEVEEIFHKFSGWSADLQKESATVVGNLDHFMNLAKHFADTPGARKEIPVATENEIVDTFRVLSPVLRDKIVPFLDNHKDMASIDRLVNSDHDSEKAFDVARRPVCDMHALIVAHLANNPRFDAILEKKRKELEGFNALDAQKFAQLVDYLTSQRKSKR